MEFRLKEGWFDYLMSGFFLGLFFALMDLIVVYHKIYYTPLLVIVEAVGLPLLFVISFLFGSKVKDNFKSVEYVKGYEQARKDFEFSVPCYVCGKPVLISNKSSIYPSVKDKLTELKISHKECLADSKVQGGQKS